MTVYIDVNQFIIYNSFGTMLKESVIYEKTTLSFILFIFKDCSPTLLKRVATLPITFNPEFADISTGTNSGQTQ